MYFTHFSEGHYDIAIVLIVTSWCFYVIAGSLFVFTIHLIQRETFFNPVTPKPELLSYLF